MKKVLIILLMFFVFQLGASTLIQPAYFKYLGAFRLPDGISDVKTWEWGGEAMTYNPNGDPTGTSDGFPGSIFGAGHAWEHQISEITIPIPINSPTKNLNELNTAETLQGFKDILNVSNLEIPRTGLAYLSKQGIQTSDKLHFCWGYHMQEGSLDLTHGWSETNLSNPNISRGWYLGNVEDHIRNMSVNDYMFEIPSSWADQYTSKRRLATGRFRDGGWSGQGPALFAIAPWDQGNPPPSGTALNNTPLLLYSSTLSDGNNTMVNYHNSDEWTGGAWLTAGSKSAVIFVGTKGTGDCWYGDSNGPCLECAGERGWWSTGFEGQFLFFNPSDLADVASGAKQTYEPQPYAVLNIDQYLYHITSTQQWYHLGAVCYDRERGFLYVFEPFADGDKPIVHVWEINGNDSNISQAEISINKTSLYFNSDGSNSTKNQEFIISNSGESILNWSLTDNASWLSCSPASGIDTISVTVSVDPSGLTAGVYTATITVKDSNAGNSPQAVIIIFKIYNSGSTTVPFGAFDSPSEGSIVSSSIPITGWALDDIEVESVKIYRDPVSGDGDGLIYIGDALFVDGARPDVEIQYPDYPLNYRAGWGYMLLTNFLPNGGNGTFVLTAIAIDKEGNSITLGAKTIISDNANAVKPFGAIDTPIPGSTTSGTYRNQGWVLTPMPNNIPADGSSIKVYIDGVFIGNPTYNIYRSDIASYFPAYSNSNGALAYFDFETSTYTNGIHTIQWSAADSAGNTDGIGSRYFSILNTSSDKKGVESKKLKGESQKNLSDYKISNEPIKVLKGFSISGLTNSFADLHFVPVHDSRILIKELERIVLILNPNSKNTNYSGYLKVDKKLKKLPIGSSLKNGKFYWSPGPGFIGRYNFIFIDNINKTRKDIKVIISSNS